MEGEDVSGFLPSSLGGNRGGPVAGKSPKEGLGDIGDLVTAGVTGKDRQGKAGAEDSPSSSVPIQTLLFGPS